MRKRHLASGANIPSCSHRQSWCKHLPRDVQYLQAFWSDRVLWWLPCSNLSGPSICTAWGSLTCPCPCQNKAIDPGGVASCTGTSTPACSILFISCWNMPYRCMGIGQHGVCLGGMLESICIWQSAPRNLPIPWKTSGYCCSIISLLVINLGPCFLTAVVWVAISDSSLWAGTSCFCTCSTFFVFFGWSTELVMRLTLGGR